MLRRHSLALRVKHTEVGAYHPVVTIPLLTSAIEPECIDTGRVGNDSLVDMLLKSVVDYNASKGWSRDKMLFVVEGCWLSASLERSVFSYAGGTCWCLCRMRRQLAMAWSFP